MLHSDIYVLINDKYRTMTSESHNYVVAVGSFCLNQKKICNLTTLSCKKQSLFPNEMTNNFSNIQVEDSKGIDGRPKDVIERCMTSFGKTAGMKSKRRSRAQKEVSAKEVKGFYK